MTASRSKRVWKPPKTRGSPSPMNIPIEITSALWASCVGLGCLMEAEWAEETLDKEDDRRSGSQLFRTLSVVSQRGNALSVMGTLGQAKPGAAFM
ncbi:hypothetical protein EVAR_53413_1 [Eumeta japonica]|uniref:Uncharacterized protein n=1 Tax=Eumeta variegata TaxID=151549 RepID=A0A4C1XNH8_EUMVA|nr:hypothetical protein EVAR_53413_1 [Eumeta japonica]